MNSSKVRSLTGGQAWQAPSARPVPGSWLRYSVLFRETYMNFSDHLPMWPASTYGVTHRRHTCLVYLGLQSSKFPRADEQSLRMVTDYCA